MTIVAVVGLGYVGLPLAVEFGKKFETIGYDLSEAKIANYKNYCDPTGEVSSAMWVAGIPTRWMRNSAIDSASFTQPPSWSLGPRLGYWLMPMTMARQLGTEFVAPTSCGRLSGFKAETPVRKRHCA